jgi:hypothetical protein
MVVKELVALLGIKTDKKGFDQAEGGMKNLASLAKAAAAAFAGLAIVKFTKDTVVQVANLGDKFDKLSKRTGVSTEELQQWEHAAELSGTTLGTMEVGIRRLQAAQVEAADGVATYADEFKRLGVEAQNTDGTFKDVAQLLPEVADGMKGLKSDSERSAVAMKLLGRGGVQLLPMLNQGGDAIRDMMQEMHALGGVIDDELIQASADYIDNQRRLNVALQGVKNSLAKNIIPAVNELTSGFIEWWKANGQLIRQNVAIFFGRVARIISANVAVFARLLKVIFNLAKSMTPLQKKIAAVGVAIVAIGAAIMAGPIGVIMLFIAAIALLIEDFEVWRKGGKSVIGDLMKWLGDLLGFDFSFEQWSQDMFIFFEGVKLNIQNWIEFFRNILTAFIDFFVTVWDDPFGAFKRFGENILAAFTGLFSGFNDVLLAFGIDFEHLFDTWKAVVIGWATDILDTVKGAIAEAGELVKSLPGVGTAIDLAGSAGSAIGGLFGDGNGAPTVSSNVSNASNTKIDINVQASPGMNTGTLAKQVGREVLGATTKQNRTAMRALTPAAG